MTALPLTTFRYAIAACALSAAMLAVCLGVVVMAALAPAPPLALPAVVLFCLGCPVAAMCELRPHRRAALVWGGLRSLSRLRHELRLLPEIEHPLGL